MNIKRVWNKIYSFYDEDIGYLASSLSFFTIFAIVPLFSLFIGIVAKLPYISIYLDDMISTIYSLLLPQKSQVVIEYVNTFLEGNENLGYISGIYIIFTSIMFFRDYEAVVSKIFGTKKRGFFKSIFIYLSMLIITPIGIILSIYVANWLHFPIFSFLIIWCMFFVVYNISTKLSLIQTKVLKSSFVASLLWYAIKYIFVYYVLYNKTYATLYGSFSTLLFILLWIYISWIIFLYGLKFSK